VPVTHAIAGIDLPDKKQMVVHLTQADRLTLRVAPGHLKAGRLLDEALSESHLLPLGGPGGRQCFRVGYSPVERGVPVVVAPVQPRGVLAVEDTAEPVTLDVRGR
jgi:hypothetical protein